MLRGNIISKAAYFRACNFSRAERGSCRALSWEMGCHKSPNKARGNVSWCTVMERRESRHKGGRSNERKKAGKPDHRGSSHAKRIIWL